MFTFSPGFNLSKLVRRKVSGERPKAKECVAARNMNVASLLHAKPDCNVLSTFSDENKRATRHLWISMILETDMANHMKGMWGLERQLKSTSSGPLQNENTFKAFDSKNYVNTLSLLLHACDLSNPTKQWNVYRRWTDLVMEEFFEQSKTEVELGIPVTLPLRETCQIDQFQIGMFKIAKLKM